MDSEYDVSSADIEAWVYEVDGFTIRAGKTARSNDTLSLRLARANDLWFHVKGHPGSHVVLETNDLDPTPSAIEWAARIAAYHSKMRAGGIVAVSHTLAKHVSKDRGAPAGQVHIKREKTIKVRPGIPTGE